MKRALFLDRDGVINVNHNYVHTRESFDFIDGIFDICRTATQRGYLIIVVTNQAGIGRGYYTEKAFHDLTDWMKEQFLARDVIISGVFWCPDHPEHGIGPYKRESLMRKPGPGMILAAAAEFDVDLENSVLLGDNQTDLQAGRAAGVRHNILYAAGGTWSPEDGVINQLCQLQHWLIR